MMLRAWFGVLTGTDHSYRRVSWEDPGETARDQFVKRKCSTLMMLVLYKNISRSNHSFQSFCDM